MIDIIPKYQVGDQVKFKASFKNPSCGLVGKEGTVATIAGVAPFYNNRTHYYLEGKEGVFPETLFAGLAAEASGEFEVLPLEEAKWYRISFSAKLTPDDLRAMKKCFFDAMNESMEIYDLEGLEIKEA
jgi:hypothetical protein